MNWYGKKGKEAGLLKKLLAHKPFQKRLERKRRGQRDHKPFEKGLTENVSMFERLDV
jgi:hypothetical protein